MSSYSLAGYGKMMLDDVRIQTYADALRDAIEPGAVVVELGTGTGVMAFLARRFGAARVYAIEPADSVEIGREIQRDLDDDGIEFIRGYAQDIELPERADVLLSDMRGVLPNLSDHLRVIVDARERMLKPGGAQLAQRDHLFAALCTDARAHHENVGLWRAALYEIDMSAAWPYAANQWVAHRVAPETLASAPARWCTLDYTTLTSPHFSGDCTLVADADATVTGYSVYFDTEVDDTRRLSNHPAQPRLAYGSAFFPLPEPIEVAAGDEVHLEIGARLVLDEYIWSWRTRAGEREFDQSTFRASPLSPAILREAEGARPVHLTDRGRAAALLLRHLEGATVDALVERILRELPDAGFDDETARALAFELIEKFGRFAPA